MTYFPHHGLAPIDLGTPFTARKRPLEVEVMRFSGDNHLELIRWMHPDWNAVDVADPTPNFFAITTLEGTMIATTGDYVVRGVKGEFYPVKPEIFVETYEWGPVDAAAG